MPSASGCMSGCDGGCVADALDMARRGAVCPFIIRGSYGFHDVDHLAAYRAGLAAGEVAVVALLQIDAHLLGSFHLKLVHRLTSAGDHRLIAVVAGHNEYISFTVFLLDWESRHSFTLALCSM